MKERIKQILLTTFEKLDREKADVFADKAVKYIFEGGSLFGAYDSMSDELIGVFTDKKTIRSVMGGHGYYIKSVPLNRKPQNLKK